MLTRPHIATICAVLRREPAPWTDGTDPVAIQRFLDDGRYHGVLPLLDSEFGSREGFDSWPREIITGCQESTLACAMRELAHRAEINRVVDTFAAADITPLLLKGIALAYSHYPNPALRPRSDADLLIPLNRRRETDRVLKALGYTKGGGVEGELVSYQATWSRESGTGIASHLDMHWRINNSQILAKLFGYDELAQRSVPLPAFGPHARALGQVDALLFACIHRAGHANAPYYVDDIAHLGDRLIWLYDMHLLLSRMSAAEQDEFAILAASKKIKAICRDALERTAECFGTPVPSRILKVLNAPGPVEPSARYFSGGPARQMIGDFAAIDRWSDRVRWLSEHAFPSSAYMRSKYSGTAYTWLPILYARRGLTGIARLIFPRDSSHRH
jgi:hypothetical protein